MTDQLREQRAASERQIRNEDAIRALRGEGPPPLVIDKRLGLALDLVSGTCVCAKCGLPTLDLFRAISLPSFLDPELFIAGLRCRSCNGEQAITLTAQDGSVVLGTSLPRS